MLILHLVALLALAYSVAARSGAHVGKKYEKRVPRAPLVPNDIQYGSMHRHVKRNATAKASKFAVDGTWIPDVPFDIGESYAGLLPVSSHANESRQLYFWYFPSENPAAKDEITIWLNGGPGCSSLEGLLQENGPFIWQYGTFQPVRNPWTWVNLTNVVWVEQPVGTGFSQGNATAKDELDVAKQFLGFFKNFMETFDLQHKKVYITGESYAGYYIPYIADAMLNANNTKHYDLNGIMMYDPSTSTDAVQEQIPAVAFVDNWSGLFAFNRTFTQDIHRRADKCGYTFFLEDNLVFPPKGPLPNPPSSDNGCDLWTDIFNAAQLTNPCFDEYQIATTCPLLWDVLGSPGSQSYIPSGAQVYFNRADVQSAINAPSTSWIECTNSPVFIGGSDNATDESPPSGLSVLPHVIERLPRTIIAHGALDYILLSNGTLLMIQNMTWAGAQGFSQYPRDEFYVPYHPDLSDQSTLAAAGVLGMTHTERNLTYVEVNLAGHMIPQYAPSAAYRQLEFLLGRIGSLTEKGAFTTDMSGNDTAANAGAMVNGTVPAAGGAAGNRSSLASGSSRERDRSRYR